MQSNEKDLDAVVDDFDYLADNLPSAAKKLDELLADYQHAESDKERAGLLMELCDIAEEVQGYADDALKSFENIADDVDEVLGNELRQRNKVKTHLRMCFQSSALGVPTKKPPCPGRTTGKHKSSRRHWQEGKFSCKGRWQRCLENMLLFQTRAAGSSTPPSCRTHGGSELPVTDKALQARQCQEMQAGLSVGQNLLAEMRMIVYVFLNCPYF